MFNVGGAELFIILLLALVVLGPDKLPSAMRTVGQWAGEMRKMANGFQQEVQKATADPLDVKSTTKAPTTTASGSTAAGDRATTTSSGAAPSSNGATGAADDDAPATDDAEPPAAD